MTDASQTGTIIGTLSGVLSLLLGFIGVRLHNKVDGIERSLTDQRVACMTRDEFTTYMEAMRMDRAAMHLENSQRLDRIEGHVSKTNVLESALLRAEDDIRDLREWKHERADPYIGAVDALNARVEHLESK